MGCRISHWADTYSFKKYLTSRYKGRKHLFDKKEGIKNR